MSDFDTILGRLRGLRKTRWGWQACCPAHDDTRPSLALRVSEAGHLLVRCHAQNCSFEAISEALGARRSDFMNPADRRMPRHEVASYDYTDEEGRVIFQVVRFDPKSFAQRHFVGGGWTWGMGDTRRVLYRLSQIANDPDNKKVFIVEGEKDVHTLEKHGFLATTNPMGAGKWLDEYSQSLKGRTCVLVPDNDKPGLEHMRYVAENLRKHGATACILHLDAKDVTDWFNQPGPRTRQHLIKLATEAIKAQEQYIEAIGLADKINALSRESRWYAVKAILANLEDA